MSVLLLQLTPNNHARNIQLRTMFTRGNFEMLQAINTNEATISLWYLRYYCLEGNPK